MIELSISWIEELLMRSEAIITFLVLKCLQDQVQSIQVFDEFRFGRLILLVFLKEEEEDQL